MSSGGRAATGGVAFQGAVTAYYLAKVLGEKQATIGLDLPPGATLECVASEVSEPVDDLMVLTSGSARLLLQVKRTVRGGGKDSPFYSVADQFVRQVLLNRSRGLPLEGPDADRLVLAVGPGTPDSIKVHLRAALNTVRHSASRVALADVHIEAPAHRVLEQFGANVEAAWASAQGSVPTEREFLKLLRLSHIVVLDVEPGGRDALQAQELLKQVVRNPDEVGRAWNVLVARAIRMAKESGVSDRGALHEVLLAEGIEVRVPRSCEEGVDALQRMAKCNAELLGRYASIRAPEGKVEVERECVDALFDCAREGSVLLAGDPGVGKSGVLHQLHGRLQDQGADVLVLLVDRLTARTQAELSAELGIEHDLVETLRSWPGASPGFLLVDALDAARDAAVAQVVRDVISRLMRRESRWRVVASIRRFDLRYSCELQRLFRGDFASPYRDPTLPAVRHLAVPPLSDGELAVVRERSPSLGAVLASRRGDLELLRNPFNLRIAAEILLTGGQGLSGVVTETALLELYWMQRVVEPSATSGDRERALKNLCERLLERRRLHTNCLDLDARSEDVNQLLTRGVLTEWRSDGRVDRHQLAFSHHRLFDYAIAQLLLWPEEGALVDRVRRDGDFAVVARPSLSLHFHLLWEKNRDRFWRELTATFREASVPPIAAIAGPGVVAASAHSLSDLAPLARGLYGSAERAQWLAVLRHLIGTLLAEETPLAGEGADVWCKFAAQLSAKLTGDTVWATRVLIARAVRQHADLSDLQRTAINAAATGLLRFRWSAADGGVDVGVGVEALCKTFEGDPVRSRTLLGELLTPQRLEARGFEEVPVFARHAPALYQSAPSLVADLYEAAFGFHEDSKERTHIGGGAIMSMSSNRAQDYEHARWQLAEDFGRFLEACPEEATRALCAVAHRTALRRAASRGQEEPTERQEFRVRGRTCRYQADFSYVWDASTRGTYSDPRRMLDTFAAVLRDADEHANDGLVERLLGALMEHAEIAVLWQRVLSVAAGARIDGLLVDFARECCLAEVILAGLDTTVAAGNFITARFGMMQADHRKAIEKALWRLDADEEARSGRRLRAQDRLMGCLDEQQVVLAETKQRLNELAAAGGAPENKPLFQFSGLVRSELTTRDWLEDEGVNVADPLVADVLDAIKKPEAFTNRIGNASPTAEDARMIASDVVALRSALGTAEMGDADEAAVAAGWGHLASVCATLARAPGLACDDGPGAMVREVLLEASDKPWPKFDEGTDKQFETGPSWGLPNARISAAEGVANLARSEWCANDEVFQAVQRLVADEVAAVRYQIATRLVDMYSHRPDMVWELATERASEEKNLGVLRALLVGTLAPLCGPDVDRVIPLVLGVLEYAQSRKAEHFAAETLALVTELHIYRAHSVAAEAVKETLSRIVREPEAAEGLLMPLRSAAVFDDADDPEHATGVRGAALTLMKDMAVGAMSAWNHLAEPHANNPEAEWAEQDIKRGRSLAGLVEHVCKDYYFASDAFALEQDDEKVLTAEARKRFYDESGALLEELVRVPFPAAAHDVIKTLESYVELDPSGVFLQIAKCIRAAKTYPSEWLGVQVVVRLVRRYLADHRALLREDDDCREALVEVLNLFVEAGWPDARRLTYGLDEIFR